MDLLITVSKPESANIVAPLLRACTRSSCHWELFLTHKGVQVLNNQEIVELLKEVNTPVFVCHDSWTRYTNDEQCPVTLGSQTNHSEMIARANRVISL